MGSVQGSITDTELTNACMTVRAYAVLLEGLLQEGRLHAVGTMLDRIAAAVRDGGYRVNDLMFNDSPLPKI